MVKRSILATVASCGKFIRILYHTYEEPLQTRSLPRRHPLLTGLLGTASLTDTALQGSTALHHTLLDVHGAYPAESRNSKGSTPAERGLDSDKREILVARRHHHASGNLHGGNQ